MAERTYTTEQAAAELGVPRQRIAEWKARGRVVPVGYLPGRGRDVPLYLLEELKPLAEAYLRRVSTRRENGR